MQSQLKAVIARAALAAAACLLALHAAAADRVALLIGNNAYGSAPLRNAVNDAHDLGEALKELGFQVIVRENASRKDMIDAVREFGAAIEGANTALFFYAGHAMQFKDRNYLIPIDAAMGSEEDITFFSVEIGQIFDRMDRARTKFNFIILDACRDNPFAASFKLTSAGLAQMSAPSGTLIAYATAPGSVAADGYGRNGIYTKHILQNIKVPDLPAEIMFKRVREGVERETRRLQTPWDSSSLKGDFAFNSTGGPGKSQQVAGNASPSADMTLQIEREFWVSVRESNRPEDIRAYLDKYPSGNFAALARNRLEALLRPGGKPEAAEPVRVAAAEPPPVRTVPAESRAPASQAPAAPPQAEKVAVATPAPPSAPKVAPVAAPAAAAVPAPAVPASAPSSVAQPAAAGASKPDPIPGREIAPGVRELTFADGSIYRGAMRGASLHGKGEYISKSFKYEGEWSEGLKQGEGTYVWENGDRYQGHFAADRPDGRGRYQFANGDSYEGEVQLGVIVGRGSYTTKGGDVFDGSFAGGKPDGVGVYRFASGDRYEGEMVQGKMQGKGRYYTKGGDRVEGTFDDGKASGKGVYYFSNGDRYEGEMTAGALTGQGTYFFATGMKYEGEMRDGRPQGKGTFWFLDGTRFEGTFEGGLAHARGEIVKPDGARAAAEIVDGTAKIVN
ncbi:MAG TPA: caspase family protein [Usitatibacter sp.]|nr:caspase family protein [Usitatibacter sp.]